MTSATISPAPASLHLDMTPVRPPALCPEVSPVLALTESEKEKHAERMLDTELVAHLESKLRPVRESLRSNVPYILEARNRFAHPGRRVPVTGEPSYTEWIHRTLGVSDRQVRRLLAAAKEPTNSLRKDETAPNPRQEKRDEAVWLASRISHAALGLDEPDERDPSGANRKAALTLMAHEFLNLAGRKHIPVVTRLRKLQPGDFRGLCAILAQCLAQCLAVQLNDVFAPLDEKERSKALRLFTEEIANRYD